MRTQKLIMVAAITAILGACSSTEQNSSVAATDSLTASIPQWVLNPSIENGIAATDCVKFSGNLSIDQKAATANGRLSLAQQIETRIEALDKTYANRTDSNNDTTVGSTFSSVSKQLTKQTLVGSRAIKSDIVDIAGKQHFCVLTALTPSATKDLFDSLIKESGRSVNPQAEEFLYQEFKAYKAEQSLDKEIERLTN